MLWLSTPLFDRTGRTTIEAQEIRRLRERLGLTQLQLAQMLGVHPITLSKWERGAAQPPPYNNQQLQLMAGGAEQMNEEERNQFLRLIGLGVFVGALAAVIAIAVKNRKNLW